MARRWMKLSISGRRRISFPRSEGKSLVVADKGHFVVYTADERRFMIPLVYLTTKIFRELLRMSAEVFGLPGDGPITLPCDASFMDYIILSVQKCTSKDLENALLTSMSAGRCSSFSSSLIQGQTSQQIPLHAF
ncbi:hypothetical protein NE237_018972 [Protea cynaroides]|uniref:Small auxin up regulated protein n=1 Tax=Protea cynaroides TaxID=273540 RepID=A0A9Q0QPJ0_9MAGN|nr:hypothetical protein NE237_018972 [Protea cynaroides]